MNTVRLAVLVLLAVKQTSCYITEGKTEEDYITCKRRAAQTREVNIPMDYSEEVIEWLCIQNLIRPLVRKGYTQDNFTVEQTKWLEKITIKVMEHASTVVRHYRVRKEYRTLAKKERSRFHDAVNKLHNDFYKYSALVKLYASENADLAHLSPTFFPWHRIFLLLFEEALREYDLQVTVPYWDSTLDAYLDDATKSSLWSDGLLGNGRGFVTTGPFANWTTTEGTTLLRNIGEAGRLITLKDLNNVFSQSYLGGISYPSGNLRSNIENFHGAVQLWVGGDMAQLALAPNDPAFFINLAFVDLIWEEFRQIQLSMAGIQHVSPYSDWPKLKDKLYDPKREIGILPKTQNIHGLSGRFGEHIYTYTARLICTATDRSCGDTEYIKCNVKLGVCLPVVSVSTLTDDLGVEGIQNAYCVNKRCSTDEWVYAAVGVIHYRPPEYKKYNAYPVSHSIPQYKNDIYASSDFAKHYPWYAEKYNKMGKTPEYLDCKGKGRMLKQKLNIVSYGLTYDGVYRDYIVVDKRMSLYESMGFIAIKRPNDHSEYVRAMIRVYDECGRICLPACHIQGSPQYSSCSGIIQTTLQRPKVYFDSIHQTMDSLWKYTDNFPLPIKANEQIHYPFLQFYCEFDGQFPWYRYDFIQSPDRPDANLPPIDKYRTLWKWNATLPASIDATIDQVGVDNTTTTPVVRPPTTTLPKTPPSKCYAVGECYDGIGLDGCRNCTINVLRPCPDVTHLYLHCGFNSKWVIQPCPPDLHFNCEVLVCDYLWRVKQVKNCKWPLPSNKTRDHTLG